MNRSEYTKGSLTNKSGAENNNSKKQKNLVILFSKTNFETRKFNDDLWQMIEGRLNMELIYQCCS